jgi:hypothetical protein
MSGTGRRPYATPDTPTYGVPNPRLSPPVGLPDAEKRAFMALITSTPASQFAANDLPLIVRFCELSVLAERAAEGLRNAPLLDGEGRREEQIARVTIWTGINIDWSKRPVGCSWPPPPARL